MRAGGWRGGMSRFAWVIGIIALGCGGDSDPTGPGDNSMFAVTVRYLGNPTAAQRQAVQSSVARWRSAIVAELPDVPLSIPANACFDGQPSISETIDDLLLYVQFASIDGPGATIAQAGPCYVRSASSLPLLGVLTLDQDDLGNLARTGLLDDVILHELGHVLGIGTLWSTLALLSGAGGADPQFTGTWARAEYQALIGSSSTVPVENTGGAGTRDGHWRETVFGNELMTGTLNHADNPLSAMTIASLRDLGYTIDAAAASPYSLPTAALQADAQQPGALELPLHERLIRPRPLP